MMPEENLEVILEACYLNCSDGFMGGMHKPKLTKLYIINMLFVLCQLNFNRAVKKIVRLLSRESILPVFLRVSYILFIFHLSMAFSLSL